MKEYNDLSIQAEQYEEFFSGLEKNISYAEKTIKETTNPTERQQMEIYNKTCCTHTSAFIHRILICSSSSSMMQSMEALKLSKAIAPKDEE